MEKTVENYRFCGYLPDNSQDSCYDGGTSVQEVIKLERTRQAKWDKRCLRSATTKLPVEYYMEFRIACYAAGRTPYAVLRQLIDGWMKENG